MGVKAVWARSTEPVMCFGSRGDTAAKSKAYYAQARVTAERAQTMPYFVTIGGGDQVPPALRGRALELVRATGVYGETQIFVQGDELRERLSQWPVAILTSEVYSIDGEPLLVEDLGFADRRILTNAFDTVIRDDDQINRLWLALKDRAVRRRWDVILPAGFRDPSKVQLCGTSYPKLSSSEGHRVWELSLNVERSRALAIEAKERNRTANGGVLICEACGFSDSAEGMFDAHHIQPLAAGIRESRADDLAILCPTCHRWAHEKAPDKLTPLSIREVAAAISSCASRSPSGGPVVVV